MNYGNIKYFDIANGEGVRTSLFVSGCTHHCKECFNPETWAFDYGKVFDEQVEKEILESLKPDYVNGLTLLGGEPMEPSNQKALLPFVKKVKAMYPNKTIWCYSGYLIDDLLGKGRLPMENGNTNFHQDLVDRAHCAWTKELLGYIDVLVDGEFKMPLKDITLRFKGSKNQRVIDVKETLKRNLVVLSPYNEKKQSSFK
ncbi:MAG: anaerobic ribonucleoside-triphosphate reductase activating protein [Clostridia bacterium]|nr:anaerobic ribonucleoside-triphosphate reductase activating protein [Clostridia bacterium]